VAGVCRGIYGAVPQWLRQTASAGEHVAVLEAGQVLMRQELKLDYHADCAAVVTGFDGGYEKATGPRRAHASIWRLLDAGWECFKGVHKVRAHQAKVEDPTSWEEELDLLNQLADTHANKGRALHDIFDVDHRMHEAEQSRCTACVLQMARALAAAPRPLSKEHWPARRLGAKTAPREARPGVKLASHELVQLSEKLWRCRHCLRDTSPSTVP